MILNSIHLNLYFNSSKTLLDLYYTRLIFIDLSYGQSKGIPRSLQILDPKDSCPNRGNPECLPKTGVPYNPSCCTRRIPCGPGEGQCSRDEECLPDLTCGKNNCNREGIPNDARCCGFPPGRITTLEKLIQL